ncbi:MAG: nicotinate-nucleotide--dimethylbenzimidazole phosphoribosyltransferase [Myxococcales bacterium]|nr:nicotinate-nucleotide--dimethylbenzimidazole phosphoribosyltransferase [Polyangiaceae bacterium]MDW8249411.1 nicotinate-nucleotide--dimethylbenzimidazole phosphoribosyltransferase [Myxococcales bacterium]
MLTFQVPSLHEDARKQAEDHQARLTKPPGSLGRLEDLVLQMAAIQGTPRPRTRPAACLIFATDHPVTRHGVSAYPSEVTGAMVRNFLAGGAAASVLARSLRIPLRVIDVGVAILGEESHTLSLRKGYHRGRCAELPAGDLRVEDAMSSACFTTAVEDGRQAVADLGDDLRVLLLGEMGIGNTTAASAVLAALHRWSPEEAVGRGTGVDDEGMCRKRQVVAEALRRVQDDQAPLSLLRRLGGRDMAALLGAMGAAISQRTLVLVDGFIVTAVASVLLALLPRAKDFLLFAHRSGEAAHGRALDALGAAPLLDLGLRLGEASGALTALPLLDAAVTLQDQMATFEEASVPDRLPRQALSV